VRPRVYVILLNYNGWRDTVECLETLFASDYDNYRVIVADCASTDDSLAHIAAWAKGRLATPHRAPFLSETVESPRKPIGVAVCHGPDCIPADSTLHDRPLTLIAIGENRGFAGGNNVAIRHVLTRGDARYVCLLNNDTVVQPSSLRALVEMAEQDEQIGAVGGTLAEYFAPDVIQAAAGGTVWQWNGHNRATAASESLGEIEQRHDFNFISGACLLVRADVIGRVGVLDERYFLYNEDADWCLRIKAAGFRLAHAPTAVVWHKGGQSSVHGSVVHDFHIVRSSLLFVHKLHPGRLPAALVYSIFLCLAPKIVRGQWNRFAAVWRAYGSVLTFVTASNGAARAFRASAQR
jgi:GT2 family glycosyltransferase